MGNSQTISLESLQRSNQINRSYELEELNKMKKASKRNIISEGIHQIARRVSGGAKSIGSYIARNANHYFPEKYGVTKEVFTKVMDKVSPAILGALQKAFALSVPNSVFVESYRKQLKHVIIEYSQRHPPRSLVRFFRGESPRVA